MISGIKEENKELDRLFIAHKKRTNAASRPKLIDMICDHVIKEISSGKLISGEKLFESKTARMLKVSIIPVREAMTRLQQEGWVERIANKGIHVRRIGLEDAKNLFRIRMIIEEGIIDDVVKNINNDQLEEMERLTEIFEAAKKRGDEKLGREADVHFHRLLVHFAGNPRLDAIYESILLQSVGCLFRFCDRMPSLMKGYEIGDHWPIYQAIEAHDAETAKRLLEEHLNYSYKCMLEFHSVSKLAAELFGE